MPLAFLMMALISPITKSTGFHMQDDLAALKDSLSASLSRHNVPGGGFAIIQGDTITWVGGLGLADLEKKREVSDTTVFRVGSITKVFVAMGIMKLVEENKIALDSEINKIIPEIKVSNRWQDTDPVRVIHLLEHTSGFDDMHFNEYFSKKGDTISSIDALQVNPASRKVRWKPGTATSYSNSNYAVLGHILEKFGGEGFETYLMKRILQPAGMSRSTFSNLEVKPENLAIGYYPKGGNLVEAPYKAYNFRWAGSLTSSPSDMAKFVLLLLQKGMVDSVQYFDPQTILAMETPSSSMVAKRGMPIGYGMANSISVRGKFKTYGHSGGLGGYISNMRYNRELGVGYVILLNRASITGQREALQHIHNYIASGLDGLSPALAMPLNPSYLSQFTGNYTPYNARNVIFEGPQKLLGGKQVFVQGDTLYTKAFMQQPKALIPVRDGVFRQQGYVDGHILFVEHEGERHYIESNGLSNHFIESSLIWTRVKQVAFFSSLAVLVVSVLIILIRFVKRSWRVSLAPNFYSFLSALCLFGMLAMISNLQIEEIDKFVALNWFTGSFFALSVTLTLLLLAVIYSTFKVWKRINLLHRIYVGLLSVSAFSLLLVFYDWHLLGLRLWAW